MGIFQRRNKGRTIIKNNHFNIIEKCKRFDYCNVPICPLDKLAKQRVELKEDSVCPFCRKSKIKGKKFKIPKELKKLVPQENKDLLNLKSQ